MTTAADVTTALAALRRSAPDRVVTEALVATGHIDRYDIVDGPIGRLAIAFNDHGVAGVVPVDADGEPGDALETRTGRPAVAGELPARLRSSIERVVRSGKLGALPVDLRILTPFQVKVLQKAAEIPPGELRPYGWVAREIGRPDAVRAVGTALGRNPIPVLIPCHRVSRSDGTVGQYAYGPGMKRALLDSEGLDPALIDQFADRGVRYLGTDTTNVFCLPTCRHAKRVTDRHRLEFRSREAAEESGRRPCKVCRPAVA